MRTYLVEYVDPKTQVIMSARIEAVDKTEARDQFYENFPMVMVVERITWIPSAQ